MADSPEGLVYRPDFVTPREERDLIAAIEQLDFREIRMRGQTARRTARHFGFDYDYERYGRLVPGDPLPDWLVSLRERCARLGRLEPVALAQALVQRYPPARRSADEEPPLLRHLPDAPELRRRLGGADHQERRASPALRLQ